jgi:D-alanyl-D-alanine carboxypeptidase
MAKLRFMTFGLIAMATVFAGTAVARSSDWSAVERLLGTHYPHDGPGAYAIAANGDRVIFSKGYGQANLEQHTAFTPDSVVRIASLTKQFTSVAVLLLVQDGKLTLDEALGQAWPQCPRQWCAITIRQLLSHTSGITDDLAPLYPQMKTDMTVDQLLAVYAGLPVLSPPGTTWRYSNVNFWILGKVIELESGTSYADFVRRRVLVPAMTRTRYGSHDAIIEGKAAGYERNSDRTWDNARYFSETLGYSAGGFLSTPADMATWYAALSRGAILSHDAIQTALTAVNTSDGKSTGYGLGWYVSDKSGEHVAYHGGSTFGFEASVYWVPSRSIFVGVFKNRSGDDGEPQDEARALLGVAMSR